MTQPVRGRVRRRLLQWLRQELEAAATPEPETDPDPEQAWKALTLVNDWIRHSEAKAGVVLTAAGVAGGVLYNLIKDQMEGQHRLPCYLVVLAVSCSVFIFAAGGFAAAALIPRRKIRGQPEDFSNLLYYSHIARRFADDAPSYHEVLKALTSDPHELVRHIANQVHANSIVAHRKFECTKWGIIALIGVLVLLAFLAALLGWAK
ncbi:MULTISPECIES: Pycsar system effector family protein [unclassified Mycobacterium]|uniref:Pycsar system effector family protein n=1 Tax=unclassified Mycobacterium TaxID=2642494 RepID=UPI000AE362B3|nr:MULTISPECIES: Pycsar system effector family protein [unclassified Mycobacterium]